MKYLLRSLGQSVVDLFHPRIILLLLVPPLAALALWGLMIFLFWSQLLALSNFFGDRFLFTQHIPQWMIEWFAVTPSGVTTVVAITIALLLIIPLTILTSMILTSIFAMPVVLAHIGKSFPQLEKRGALVFHVATGNLIRSSLIYIGLWIVTLPLWVFPGLNIAIPLLLNGYLNYRLFAFDALSEHASLSEISLLMKKKRIDFLILGVIAASLVLFPLLFLILPVFSALCFTHYGLLELTSLRENEKTA